MAEEEITHMLKNQGRRDLAWTLVFSAAKIRERICQNVLRELKRVARIQNKINL